MSWPLPTWPLDRGPQEGIWNRARLERECIQPWVELQKQGVGVHVGEFGCFTHTPHTVVMAWMSDLMDLWKQAGWGWAMWNLVGSFGILDSQRPDVAYEDFLGHKLDRKMLELLLAK
jgi:endoglucanase